MSKMDQRPSRAEIEKQKEKVVNELKFKGLYDDLRKKHLSIIEGDQCYKDLQETVANFTNRFFKKTRFVEGEKGLIRQRLKTEINDSNQISRLASNLAHKLAGLQNDSTKTIKNQIRESMEKYFGIDSPAPKKPELVLSVPPRGTFQNTFVAAPEENSNTCSSYPTPALLPTPKHTRTYPVPLHSDSSNLEPETDSNLNDSSKESFRPLVSFPTQVPLSSLPPSRPSMMLEMDKISDDEDLDDDEDDSSLPSPPKFEQFSPQSNPLLEDDSMDLPEKDIVVPLPVKPELQVEPPTTSVTSGPASTSMITSKFEQISDHSDLSMSCDEDDVEVQLPVTDDVEEEEEEQNVTEISGISDVSEIPLPATPEAQEPEAQEPEAQEPGFKEPEVKAEEEDKDDDEVVIPGLMRRKRIRESLDSMDSTDIAERMPTKKAKLEPEVEEYVPEMVERLPNEEPEVDDNLPEVVLLDTLLKEDADRHYSDLDLSDISSVHSCDLSEPEVYFSDSDCELFNGLKLENLRQALKNPQKFAEEMTKKQEKKSQKKKPEVKKLSKKDTGSSEESFSLRRSRRRTASSSTDSSAPPKPETSSISRSNSVSNSTRALKRLRSDSMDSQDSASGFRKRAKRGSMSEGPEVVDEEAKKKTSSRTSVQSYNASDLYKPRTSTRTSSRRSARSLTGNDSVDGPPSPFSNTSSTS